LMTGLGAMGQPRSKFPAILAAEGCYFAGVVLPPLPFYVWDRHHILGYFLSNTGQGAEAPLWRMKGGPLDVLAQYTVDGPIGEMLGNYLYALGALCLFGAALFMLGRNRPQALTLIGVLLAVSISLIIMVYGRYANSFFGLSYQILLLFGAVRSLGPHRQLGRLGNRLLFGGLAVLGLWNIAAPAGNTWARPFVAETQVGNRSAQHLVDVVTRHTPRDITNNPLRRGPVVAFTFIGSVNSSTFEWLSLKRGYDFPIRDYHRFSDPRLIRQMTADDDFLVLGSPGTLGLDPAVPANSLQGELIAAIDRDGTRRRISDAADEQRGYLVFMRENLRTVDTQIPSEGLGPVEGPYPKLGLGLVRWGLFPETTLGIDSAAEQPAEIVVGARAAKGQRMAVLANGIVVAEYVFSTGEFEKLRVSFTLQPGRNRLTFRYASTEKSAGDPRPLAVLFRQIDLTRQ
jgi:hypothetical protein